MPTYRIKYKDGRKFKIIGDRPPTPEELNKLVSTIQPKAVPTQGKNLNVPGTPNQMFTEALKEFGQQNIGPLPGIRMLQSALKGDIGGAILRRGAPEYSQMTPGQKFGDTGSAIFQSLIGLKNPKAISSAPAQAEKNFVKTFNDIADIRPGQLDKGAETITKAVARKHREASKFWDESFEKAIEKNPDVTVDTTEAINTARIEQDFDPVIRQIVEGNMAPAFKNIINNTSVGSRDALEASRQLNAIARKAAPDDPRFHTLRLVADELKASIADAIPEYKDISKQYRELVKPLKVINKKVIGRDPDLLSSTLEDKMAKNWKGNSVVRRELRHTLSDSEWKDLEKIRQQKGIKAWLLKLAGIE